MNDAAEKAWKCLQNGQLLTTAQIEALRPYLEGSGERVPRRERIQCRHGMSLKGPCTSCAEEPTVARASFPSDELEAIPLGTALEERRRAENWMDDAAHFARGQGFYRKERDELLVAIGGFANRLAAVTGDVQSVWIENRMLLDKPSLGSSGTGATCVDAKPEPP